MDLKQSIISMAIGAMILNGAEYAQTSENFRAPVNFRTALDQRTLVKGRGDQKVIVKIEVEGGKSLRLDRIPLNLAIVLDRSGSMSGEKLEQAKQAAMLLVDQLDKKDVLSLIVYETEVEVVLPAGPLRDRSREIKRIIQRIETGGSTALYGGVQEGGRQLDEFLSQQRINRVILLSDGIANVGPSSNREIAGLGSRLAKNGVSVTTIGLGDDYNETLMTALAEASDANYYYVADVEDLPSVFEIELGELQTVVAREVVVEIRCPNGVRPLRFLGRPGELKSRSELITFNTLSSEQSRELFLEVELEQSVIGTLDKIVDVEVRYLDPAKNEEIVAGEISVEVGYTDDAELAKASKNLAVAAEAAIYLNAEETEKSIAYADSGNIEACRANLESQKVTLIDAFAFAPAKQKEMLKAEIAAVEEAQRDLGNDTLSKVQRKKLSVGSYMKRNSKR
jgi:Ca-activated chloride channel family protein